MNTSKKSADRSGRGSARAHRFGLAVLMAALSVSCVETKPAGPILPLVPGDALLAVVVDSPYKLYLAAEEFWKAAGIAKVLGGDLAWLAGKNIPQADEAEKSLDFARPWALAFVPSKSPSKEFRTIVYVPVRGKNDAFLEKMVGGSMKIVAQASGYAVFADGEGEFAFPPKQPLDLSRLARYPAASIKCWTDPNALRLSKQDGFASIKGAMRRFVAGEKSGPDAAFAAIEDAAIALLRELRSADAALIPGASGMTVKAGVAAKSGGTIEKVLARASSSPSALDWASQIGSRALFGYAWSIEPALAVELSTSMMKPLFSMLGFGKEAVDRVAALQSRWGAASGPRAAYSFDMDFDPAVLKELSSNKDPAAILAGFRRLMSLDITAIQEVKDEAKYRELVRGMPKDPDLVGFFKSYTDTLGVGVELKNVEKKDGGFSYGALDVAFKVADEEKFGAFAGKGSSETISAARMAFEAVNSMLDLRWSFSPATKTSPGRFFVTTSDLKGLKALATRPAADSPISADPAFVAFAKGIVGKPLMIGSLSTRRLAAVAKKFAESEAGRSSIPPGVVLDPERFGAWYSYLAVEGKSGASTLEMGCLVPAKDIEVVMEFAMQLMSAKKQEKGI